METVERYGVEAVHGAMTYACDASAERMRFALEAVPDGEWEGEDLADCDALDDSEEYLVRVKIVKRGDRAEVDFSGSSRQARTCINCTPLDAKTTVGVAFKYLLDPRGPFTSGTMRCVDLIVPPGAVMGALPPDGAVFAYWELNQLMISAVLRALAKAARRRRPWAAIAVAPTSTTPTASSPTGRPGCRRPRSAARSARSARTRTETPTATCSRTRRTASGRPSRRSSPEHPSWCSGTRSSPTRPVPAPTGAAPR